MNLITILCALAVEFFYKPVQELRRYDWFHRYADMVYARLEGQSWRDGPVGVLLVIGSVVFAVWLVNAMLAGVAGFFSFLFGIVVLVFTLGPKDLTGEVEDYQAAVSRDDKEAAFLYASRILGYEPDVSPAELGEHVQQGILLEANSRVFGVLLWFMLLGPVGAALFRLSCELKQHQSQIESGYAVASRNLFRILIWLPVRLLVIGFALAGSFVDTFSRLDSFADFWQADSETLLVESGLGAVAHEPVGHEEAGADEEAINQMMALVKRTLLVWLAILALLTLTGWVF